MVLKLYYDLISQPARALIIFCRQAKIPHEGCAVALRKGEHLTDEFKIINPMKKVPAIDHDGFKLTESVAIFQYITREFNVPDSWYPSNSQHRALHDEFFDWQTENLRYNGTQYFRTKVIVPAMKKEPVDQEKLEYFNSEFHKNLTEIEDHFLDGKHLGGKELCFGDLLAICNIYQVWGVGGDVFSNHLKLSEWAEKTKTMSQPHFDDTHKLMYKLRKKFSEQNC